MMLCVYLQRYSVAVYLVRVFTATDLFSQLKLNSVESAERCRERSKFHSRTHLTGFSSLVPWPVLDGCGSVEIIFKRNLIFAPFFFSFQSSRQAAIWSREWNSNYRTSGVSYLSSECTLLTRHFAHSCLTHTFIYCVLTILFSFSCLVFVCSWWRCDSVCRVGFWLVPICNVSTLSSSCRWMRRSPRGPAPCVTSLPPSSSLLSMGEEQKHVVTYPLPLHQIPFSRFIPADFMPPVVFQQYIGAHFKLQGCLCCCAQILCHHHERCILFGMFATALKWYYDCCIIGIDFLGQRLMWRFGKQTHDVASFNLLTVTSQAGSLLFNLQWPHSECEKTALNQINLDTTADRLWLYFDSRVMMKYYYPKILGHVISCLCLVLPEVL